MPTRTLTDTWLDVHAAAAYAGVPFTVIAAALADHELPALTPDPERPATRMIRARDLDLWSLWALGGRPAAPGPSPPDTPDLRVGGCARPGRLSRSGPW